MRSKFFFALAFLFLISSASAQQVVSFPASDGWKLAGTLYLPKNSAGAKAPAAVLLAEPAWEDRTVYGSYLAGDLAKNGFAVLTLDYRGTGGSVGAKDFFDMTKSEREGLRLDVRAAVSYLSSRAEVDPRRMSLVAASWSADFAVQEAMENADIRALVLISGEVKPEHRDYFQSERSVPVLGVVGKEDKKIFLEVAEVFSDSPHESSDLLIAPGYGAGMFSHTKGLEQKVTAWLTTNLKGVGSEKLISFQTKDGWTIRGKLRLPDLAAAGKKSPAVVMVHGARHDQQTYDELSRELAKQGIASLRFDWRGKGLSIAPGKGIQGIDLPEDESKQTPLDVKAAINALAAESSVDSNRIGMISATAGNGYALDAAGGDSRIQTMVLLTVASDPEGAGKQFLTTSGKPVFAVASTEDVNYNRGSLADVTRRAYQLSSSRESEFLLYDDAGRGSEMFKSKPELPRMVLRWFVEKLGAGPAAPASDATLKSEKTSR
jgi:dienelactone hydrolase